MSQIERARDYGLQWEAMAQQTSAVLLDGSSLADSYVGMRLIFLREHQFDLSLSYLLRCDRLMFERRERRRNEAWNKDPYDRRSSSTLQSASD